MKKKDDTFNYLNAKLTEIVYIMYHFKTHETFLVYYIWRYYMLRCTEH